MWLIQTCRAIAQLQEQPCPVKLVALPASLVAAGCLHGPQPTCMKEDMSLLLLLQSQMNFEIF